VTAPVDEAIRRAEQRGKETGRFVPETFLRETHAAVSRTFPEAIRQGLFDSAELHDTTTRPPTLVASAIGKVLTIHSAEHWDAFVKKGHV
jgi:predicted ABC-type ATPase